MATPVSVPEPTFFTVKTRLLVAPTATSPKSRLLGETAITGLLSVLVAATGLVLASLTEGCCFVAELGFVCAPAKQTPINWAVTRVVPTAFFIVVCLSFSQILTQ